MAKDYTDLAHAVADAVGGKSNVISVTNCMTRLRFILKDDSVPNEEAVRAIPGMINPAGLDVSFYGFVVCALVAAGVSAILAFILADPEK